MASYDLQIMILNELKEIKKILLDLSYEKK